MISDEARRPIEAGALFDEIRRLHPSEALLKDIEAVEQQAAPNPYRSQA